MQNVKDTVTKVYGNYPEKVLQFGEGNFLRAFVDWMIDGANERGDYKGSVVLCQPIPPGGPIKKFINDQNGIYTVAMRGIEDGQAVEKFKTITSISRCINAYEDYDELVKLVKSPELEVVVSNTTEAGISYAEGCKLSDRPAASFPAKITQLLYARYEEFHGSPDKGLLFLPVELIDNNGAELKRIVLQYAREWQLDQSFIDWVDKDNKFTSTLVDRIVTGYPRTELDYFTQKLGYEDNVLDTCEVFNLWVIEGKKEWSEILPIHKGEAHVLWTDDVKPYKMRKVRILNGGHTSTVLAAFLAGHDIVLDFMNDPVFKSYLEKVLKEEVIPTLSLPEEELLDFASAVEARFSNPYIKHRLLDISLNSCSKFHARCLPSLLGYVEKKGELPKLLTFSLAAFIKFYEGAMVDGAYMGKRSDGTEYQIKDDQAVLEFFCKEWALDDEDQISRDVLGNTDFWGGQDLNQVKGLTQAVAGHLKAMKSDSMEELVKKLIAE